MSGRLDKMACVPMGALHVPHVAQSPWPNGSTLQIMGSKQRKLPDAITTYSKSVESLPVLIHERLHETCERLHAFNRHTIINGCSTSSNRAVACKGVQLHFLGLFQKLFLKGFVTATALLEDVEHPFIMVCLLK